MAWSGLELVGVTWSGLEWPGVGWSSLEWIGVGWSGLEWVGIAWSGLERNSIKPKNLTVYPSLKINISLQLSLRSSHSENFP